MMGQLLLGSEAPFSEGISESRVFDLKEEVRADPGTSNDSLALRGGYCSHVI